MKSISNLVWQIVISLCTLVFMGYVVKTTDPDFFGRFVILISFTALLPLLELGNGFKFSRLAAIGYVDGIVSLKSKYLSYTLKIQSITLIIAIVVAGYRLQIGSSYDELLSIIFLALHVYPVLIRFQNTALLRGYGKYNSINAIAFVSAPLIYIICGLFSIMYELEFVSELMVISLLCNYLSIRIGCNLQLSKNEVCSVMPTESGENKNSFAVYAISSSFVNAFQPLLVGYASSPALAGIFQYFYSIFSKQQVFLLAVADPLFKKFANNECTYKVFIKLIGCVFGFQVLVLALLSFVYPYVYLIIPIELQQYDISYLYFNMVCGFFLQGFAVIPFLKISALGSGLINYFGLSQLIGLIVGYLLTMFANFNPGAIFLTSSIFVVLYSLYVIITYEKNFSSYDMF